MTEKKRGRPKQIKPTIIIPKEEDIKAFAPAISESKKRIDNIRAQLHDIFKTYNDTHRNPISFTIDEEDMTIHMMGLNKGMECTTLNQPDKVILRVARNYTVPTVSAKGEEDMDYVIEMMNRNKRR